MEMPVGLPVVAQAGERERDQKGGAGQLEPLVIEGSMVKHHLQTQSTGGNDTQNHTLAFYSKGYLNRLRINKFHPHLLPPSSPCGEHTGVNTA